MKLQDVLSLPEKTYTQNNNGVQAQIMQVGDPEFKNNWWNQKLEIKDLTGETWIITHQTQYQESILSAADKGKMATWRLKWWKNSRNNQKYIVGYPQTKPEGQGVMSGQQQAKYDNASVDTRTPQHGLQSTNSDKPDWDAIAEGKVRHGVVCAFIQAGKFDVDIQVVDYWVRYIIDGSVPADGPQEETYIDEMATPPF